ncbi:hypothetical protein [Streptomyces decoyicus]|uniref:hypothetical protein n=1 Tax=Streptomyces decoyicus TaxID=249567 RepID=UPI0033B9F60E
MSSDHSLKIASLNAELRDRASENRELRREIARALRLVEAGNIDSATALLRFLSRATTDRTAEK